MVRKPYRDFFRLRARISLDAILAEKLGFVFFSLSAKVGFEAASPTFCSLCAPLRCPFGLLTVSRSWRSSKPPALRIRSGPIQLLPPGFPVMSLKDAQTRTVAAK